MESEILKFAESARSVITTSFGIVIFNNLVVIFSHTVIMKTISGSVFSKTYSAHVQSNLMFAAF